MKENMKGLNKQLKGKKEILIKKNGRRLSWNEVQGVLGKGFVEDGRALFTKKFNITEADIALGLRHIKALVRHQYRELAKRYHPDSTIKNKVGKRRGKLNGSTFRDTTRIKKQVSELTIMPITLDNLEAILEINKGYISTRDVFLPWE